MFAGFLCFNNIFCAATNFGCIDSFLLPNSRNEEMMGDTPFESVSVNIVNINVHDIQYESQQKKKIFFMVLFPMLFEVRRIVCVEN